MRKGIANLLGYTHLVELLIEVDYLDGYYEPQMCWVKDVSPLMEDNFLPNNWIRGIDYDYDDTPTTEDWVKVLKAIEKKGCCIEVNICVNYTCEIFDIDTMTRYTGYSDDSFNKCIELTVLKYLKR